MPEIRPLVRIDLLLTAAAVRTSGIGSATAVSYRQLTGGRIPAQCRTFVVLRVLRPPGWSDADLRPTMSAATRRVAKRLGPHRRLGHEDAATTLAELAHHDFTSRVDERWTFVEIGGLCQAAYRVTLPAGNEDTARAMHRLLTLPTAAIAICVSPRRFAPSLAVRLAAESPQQLERADQALRQLAAAERATVHRLDGEHRIAAAETLLVGGRSGSLGIRPSDTTAACRGDPAGGAASSRPPDERQHVARPDATRPRPRPSPRPRRPQPTPQPYAGSWPQTVSGGAALPLAGLVLGYDRHGIPVVAKIFRPAPTRIVVVAGLRTAQLVAIRALALGAQVDVRTRRWAAWSGFADEVTAPTRNIVVTPDAAAIPDWASPSLNGGMPTRMASTTPPGTPLRPTLTIVDAATRGLRPANGPGTDRPADQGSATPPGNTRGWHATIIVRDELTSADTPLLTTADLVMLQNLRPGEANLVADTFALEGQLTGLGDEIVAMIATGQPLRWAALAPTPVERSLTDQGTPSDVDALQPVTRAGNSLRGGD
ncbi:hypothetical protein [Asanoa ferruginea]|uniref:hypothetical protein n=1 Tax=Asanoa ferruginea TaxID=53367 RepID=UPI0019405B09|nr:hypothetical protein [Asanoa ferruginea]